MVESRPGVPLWEDTKVSTVWVVPGGAWLVAVVGVTTLFTRPQFVSCEHVATYSRECRTTA